MELLIAVLISLGFVTSGDADKLSQDQLDKIVHEKNISQEDIKKEASIIGLEESDF
jgi:hypothetical protein